VVFKKPVARDLDRVAKLYLGTEFFGSCYFAWPIFYGFATEALTPAQVGVFFSVLSIIQFAADVPTGVIADKYSRKLCGIFGTSMALIAPLIIYFGHNFPAYLVAAFFYGVGRAFLSGTLDSLVYDHRNVSQADFRRVAALDISFSQAGTMLSAATGGFLFSAHQSLPFIAEALAGITCLGLIFFMQETTKDGYARPTASHTRHFVQGLKYLLATRYLRVIVLLGVVFAVMLRICIQFVNEATMIEHGFQPTTRGLLMAAAGIVTIVFLNVFLLKVLRQDRARLLFMGFGAVAAFSLMSINVTAVFLVVYFLWNWLVATQSPFVKPMLQDRLPSSHRSTAMSGFTTLVALVAFGGSATIGLFVQWAHTPRAAYVLFAVISLAVLLPCALWLANQIKTNTERV
jgi:MFS family permease